jgi:outer membrane protein OmpA-like peptidoglycan-associated protein
MRHSGDIPNQSDEGIAWPSYVDFLSTFIFVLLIFIGSLLYLLSGDIRLQSVQKQFAATAAQLQILGLEGESHGMHFSISLRRIITFQIGCPRVNDACDGVSADGAAKLQKVAALLPAYSRCRQITLQGQTDALQPTVDHFANYKLSTRRAETVLEFFSKCTNCGPEFEKVKPKITLAGIGDRNANKTQIDNVEDRTVDIIIDCSGTD